MHLLISILLIIIPALGNDNAELTIIIENIKHDKGQIIIGICDSEDSFPKKPFIRKSVKIKNGVAILLLKDIKYGEYAVSIIHDENSNNKIDFHFYGPPKEQTAASNNAKSFFGPPNWDDAKFVVDKEVVEIKISM